MSAQKLSRRNLLKLSGVMVGSTVLAACGVEATTQPPKPTDAPKATDAPKPTDIPATQAPPPAPTGAVTIMMGRNEFSEDAQKMFEGENAGITITQMELDTTAFFALVAAGTAPDLLRVDALAIPRLLRRKLIKDLSAYFAASTLLKADDLTNLNDYYLAESETAIGTGKRYGMAKDASPDMTLFANKKVFEDAGVSAPDDTKALTYAELYDLAKSIVKKDGDKIVNFGLEYEPNFIDRNWMTHLAETGQSLYNADGTQVALTGNEEAKAIAKWYYDLAAEGITTSAKNPAPNGWSGGDFGAGVLGLTQWGYWFSAMAETDAQRGSVMMLPAPTWSGKRADPTITATGLVLTDTTQVADAAWKLFEWYMGGKPAEERAASGWGVPSLKHLMGLIPQTTDFQKQCYKVLEGELALNTAPLQFNPYVNEGVFPTAWNKNLGDALAGTIDFDTMLANIESEVNMSMADNM